MDTAGRAVVFAGITVVLSLLGMLLIGLPFIAGLGIAAAATVLVTLLASITLLPALLAFADDAHRGHPLARPDRRRLRRRRRCSVLGLGIPALGRRSRRSSRSLFTLLASFGVDAARADRAGRAGTQTPDPRDVGVPLEPHRAGPAVDVGAARRRRRCSC